MALDKKNNDDRYQENIDNGPTYTYAYVKEKVGDNLSDETITRYVTGQADTRELAITLDAMAIAFDYNVMLLQKFKLALNDSSKPLKEFLVDDIKVIKHNVQSVEISAVTLVLDNILQQGGVGFGKIVELFETINDKTLELKIRMLISTMLDSAISDIVNEKRFFSMDVFMESDAGVTMVKDLSEKIKEKENKRKEDEEMFEKIKEEAANAANAAKEKAEKIKEKIKEDVNDDETPFYKTTTAKVAGGAVVAGLAVWGLMSYFGNTPSDVVIVTDADDLF